MEPLAYGDQGWMRNLTSRIVALHLALHAADHAALHTKGEWGNSGRRFRELIVYSLSGPVFSHQMTRDVKDKALFTLG